MAYYVGDIPSEDIVIEPARNEELIDLTPFTDALITLHGPEGDEIPTIGFVATIDVDQVIIEWPTTTVLDTAGRYALVVTLDGPAARERLAPLVFIVQGDDGWVSLDVAREDWPDAPRLDRKLYELLVMAQEQVLEYGQALAEGSGIPERFARAQLMQARNIWNATKVDPSNGGFGEDSFVVRPFPLDWMVKQIIRPKRGTLVVG